MTTYLGVDVASATLEVWDPRRRHSRSFDNSPRGIQALGRWILQGEARPQDLQVVLEPTSVYHHHLVAALQTAQVPYTVINPARTAAYARAEGQRAKTDPVDARLLARMGEEKQMPPTHQSHAQHEELKALRRHRDWLEEERQRVENRLKTARRSPRTPQPVLESLERTRQRLAEEIRQLDKALQTCVQEHPNLAGQVQLLQSIRGIGAKTAVLLVSELPPVDQCADAKDWVAASGLNPLIKQSGKAWQVQLSKMGPSAVRGGLYMPAMTALRYNPMVKALGERLAARGKSDMELIVAAMTKLVRQSFGVLKSGQPFDPTWHLQRGHSTSHSLTAQHGI